MTWQEYVLDWSFEFSPSSTILDIGCGVGTQLAHAPGRVKIGLEPDPALAAACYQRGFPTIRSKAEHLPFPDNAFDGIICKVVLPLTVEDQAVSEIARVLKPNGKCYLITIGSGYYLSYLLRARSPKLRLYGLRTLLNTWYWVLFHRRLPGFVGDTTYQSTRRLRRYFREGGLTLVRGETSNFFWFPVFIYSELTIA